VRRFFELAAVHPAEGGFGVALDGKPVRTPGRRLLAMPTEALAAAIAAEWNAQGEKIDPRSMHLTGLANAAIDRIAHDKEAFAGGLAVYGESDLLCYRADGPDSLVCHQAEHWDPILAWARRRYDVDFEIVAGIVHRPQPVHTINKLSLAVHSRGPFELAGLSPLVTVSGSLLIGLAVAEQSVGLEQAWNAATADEQWQAAKWGEDEEAVRALAARRRDFEAASRFLALL
jgi:chaperone required for assembly of F1-ATPase